MRVWGGKTTLPAVSGWGEEEGTCSSSKEQRPLCLPEGIHQQDVRNDDVASGPWQPGRENRQLPNPPVELGAQHHYSKCLQLDIPCGLGEEEERMSLEDFRVWFDPGTRRPEERSSVCARKLNVP